MSISMRLKCDECGTTMRGRDNETVRSLRERAEHAGWLGSWRVNYRDLCQVCAPKFVVVAS